MAGDMHIVLEGVASRVDSGAPLEQVADAYRSKYQWPVTVVDGGFEASYAAPAAGPPPYQPYRVTPRAAFAVVTDDALGPRHTAWRFWAVRGADNSPTTIDSTATGIPIHPNGLGGPGTQSVYDDDPHTGLYPRSSGRWAHRR